MKRTELYSIIILFVFSFLVTSCVYQVKRHDGNSSTEPQLFYVTYLPNGANGEFLEEEILSGEQFTIKDNFYEAPKDMKFAYWNTRRNGRGTTYNAGDTIKMPYYDLYLYAYWIDSDSYSIVYKNCEEADNSENVGEFKKTDDITLSEPTKTGYIFEGWYLTEDFSEEAITGWAAGEKNGSITIYAKWTPEKRTLNYKAGIGTGSDKSFEVDYDDILELPDCLFIPPRNKKFTNWIINGEEYKTGESFGPVHDDLEISAEYEYFSSGDVSKKFIEINGKVLEKTEEVCVVSPVSSYVINGSDDVWSSYIWKDDHYDFKGAFSDGRKISLSPYAVSKFMVTRELFKEVFGEESLKNSSAVYQNENSDYVPAGGISWYISIAFCNKLTLLTGGTADDLVYYVENVDWETLTIDDIPVIKDLAWEAAECDITKSGYRLLTEAEWEFAARGGDTSREEFNYAYPGVNSLKPLTYSKEEGDEMDLANYGYEYKISSKTTTLDNWSILADDVTLEYAWLKNNSNGTPHEAGLLKPNSLGIYDMAGNLWEWVWDYYIENPTDADYLYQNDNGLVVNPMGPETGTYRIRKGSNFQTDWGMAVKASSGYRGERMEAKSKGENYGLRIGRSLVN